MDFIMFWPYILHVIVTFISFPHNEIVQLNTKHSQTFEGESASYSTMTIQLFGTIEVIGSAKRPL